MMSNNTCSLGNGKINKDEKSENPARICKPRMKGKKRDMMRK